MFHPNAPSSRAVIPASSHTGQPSLTTHAPAPKSQNNNLDCTLCPEDFAGDDGQRMPRVIVHRSCRPSVLLSRCTCSTPNSIKCTCPIPKLLPYFGRVDSHEGSCTGHLTAYRCDTTVIILVGCAMTARVISAHFPCPRTQPLPVLSAS